MPDQAKAMYPDGPTQMNPWHVGKLLSGEPKEREKIVSMYGYQTSLNVLRSAINGAKTDIDAETDSKAKNRLQEYHDYLKSYHDELLGRQAM